MNSNNFLELVQKGFRVTLGATASLVESVQDTQKREQNLELLKSDVNLVVQQLAEKGEITELEARTFLNSLMAQGNDAGTTQSYGTPSTSATTPVTTVAQPDVQLELEELTAQIAAMRTELEKLRDPNSGI
jgi:polyhydroxyalkanoate synthesis regulator phasin